MLVRSGTTTKVPSATLAGGDATGDGRVDLADLVRVAVSYESESAEGTAADCTGDGAVTVFDLVLVAANYGIVGPLPWGDSGSVGGGPVSGAYDLSEVREFGPDDGAPVLLATRRLDAEMLAVDVIARNLTRLYGAEASLVYDAKQLQILDMSTRPGVQVRPGAMWSTSDSAFVAMNDGRHGGDRVRFAATRMSPAEALEGDQVIQTVVFRLRVGEPDRAFALSDVELVSDSGEQIPARWQGVAPRDGWRIVIPFVAARAVRP